MEKKTHSPSDRATHSTTEPLAQSQAGWVTECEADFRRHELQPPYVHELVGQELSDPQFKTLFHYWSTFPRIDGVPVIAKIDPLGFRQALGDVIMLEPIPEEDDFRYRLFGSGTVARLGEDMTGRKVSELPAAPSVRRFILRSYKAAVEERQAYLTMHILPDYVSTENWRRIILPISDEAGTIYRLLVGNLAGEWRQV